MLTPENILIALKHETHNKVFRGGTPRANFFNGRTNGSEVSVRAQKSAVMNLSFKEAALQTLWVL